MYNQAKEDIPSLDITNASVAVHHVIKGVAFEANSWKALEVEKDYNKNLVLGKEWMNGGRVTCLSHALALMKPTDDSSKSSYRLFDNRNKLIPDICATPEPCICPRNMKKKK